MRFETARLLDNRGNETLQQKPDRHNRAAESPQQKPESANSVAESK